MGGISIWQLLIIFAIIILLFGTKKLRNLGTDLGGAVKGFKKAMGDEETKNDSDPKTIEAKPETVDAAKKVETNNSDTTRKETTQS
ncbi:twin-arginine translocation protein tatA/E [Oleiphilus messinensis]|uniref:Sec-independent protein translocase protein TatA n=1 Tax=Oleiphilus messinensis TaxID=141451 RepID=A0A1Y0I6C4_9GAMM|nr:Sec-independent protein translocase subunit TatA [Oleiphilus messinensis]ARU55085.1 twin-arginine translocation protein tatA/E [Oleiphilus messinensis]